MIRVLVADDSATARALLVSMLASDPKVQVVGEARDGVEAVELTKLLRPQLVTMDILMPRMDGFEATKRIMIDAPTPIVVVTGRTDAHEVEVSMQALRAGALCVMRKPPGPHAPEFLESARQLVDTVKAMADVKVVRHRDVGRPGGAAASAGRSVGVIAIAASTGGPAALHQLLSQLPREFPVPVLVVQHMSSGFAPGLARWLNGASALEVKIADQGARLAAGTVYLAPDARHLGVTSRSRIVLSDEPPIGGFRPSANFLFESVGRVFGTAAVAVVLTGMGDDGAAGVRTVHDCGGRVLAQDEASSVVFGMPRAVVLAGLAHAVLPLADIARELGTFVECTPNGNGNGNGKGGCP